MKKLISMMVLMLVMTVGASASMVDQFMVTGCGEFPVWVITGNVREDLAPNYHPISARVDLLASDSMQVCQTLYADSSGNFAFNAVYVPNYYYLRYTGDKNIVSETNLTYTYQYMEPIQEYLEVIP